MDVTVMPVPGSDVLHHVYLLLPPSYLGKVEVSMDTSGLEDNGGQQLAEVPPLVFSKLRKVLLHHTAYVLNTEE